MKTILDDLLDGVFPMSDEAKTQIAKLASTRVRPIVRRQHFADRSFKGLQAGDPFDYVIPVEVSGKTGEMKKVSVGASAGGKLLLFRGYGVKATDTAIEAWAASNPANQMWNMREETTAVVGVEVEGFKTPRELSRAWRWHLPTRDLTSAAFGRSDLGLYLHPRQQVTLSIMFYADCTWKGWITGRAVEVADEGVYAAPPPAEPCGRLVPGEFAEPESVKWASKLLLTLKSGERCDACWHTYGEHKRWPWKKWQRAVEVDLDGGSARDARIEVENRVLVTTAIVGGFDDWAPVARNEAFGTDGFSVDGGRNFTGGQYDSFAYHQDLLVPAGRELLFRVKNKGAGGMFKGGLIGYEHVSP